MSEFSEADGRLSTSLGLRGIGALKLFFLFPALLLASGIGWYSNAVYQRNYWDDKVRSMCSEEGGVRVFERVTLEGRRYLDADNNIRIPSKIDKPPEYGPLPFEAKPDDLFFTRIVTSILRAESPRVARDDIYVIRTSDKKILGQATIFARIGGDPIALDFESRLRCPVDADVPQLVKKSFITQNIPGTK